MNLHLFNMCLP